MVSAEFSALGQADFCDATDPGVSREDIEDHLQERLAEQANTAQYPERQSVTTGL